MVAGQQSSLHAQQSQALYIDSLKQQIKYLQEELERLEPAAVQQDQPESYQNATKEG